MVYCSCDLDYELQFDNRLVKVLLLVISHLQLYLYVIVVDVDECLTDNGGCTQTCNNIDGSYQCSCQDGYQLDSDDHTCIGMYCITQ